MRYYLFTLLFLLTHVGYGQEPETFFSDWKPGISYYGNNLWNPGLLIGFEKVLFEKEKMIIKKKYSKIIYRQSVLDAKIGFYYDNPSHTAIFNHYTINYRRLKSSGRYSTFGLGPGITKTFLPETYQVNQAGVVSLLSIPGRLYFSPLISVGTGKLWTSSGRPGWQLKLHTSFLVNYNKFFIPLFNVEFGYTFGYTKKEEWEN